MIINIKVNELVILQLLLLLMIQKQVLNRGGDIVGIVSNTQKKMAPQYTETFKHTKFLIEKTLRNTQLFVK